MWASAIDGPPRATLRARKPSRAIRRRAPAVDETQRLATTRVDPLRQEHQLPRPRCSDKPGQQPRNTVVPSQPDAGVSRGHDRGSRRPVRISQASASAIPAPAAGPAARRSWLPHATSAPVKVRCLVRRSATRSSSILRPCWNCSHALDVAAGAEGIPAPVINSAPTFGSSPHCLIIRRKAGVR